MTTLLLAILLTLIPPTQPTTVVGEGLAFHLRVQSGSVGGHQPSGFPEGAADMEVVTDGKSIRVTLHGQIGEMQDGSISLAPAGQRVRYLINERDRTFRVKDVVSPRAAAGESALIKPTDVFQTIEGHRAQKFLLPPRRPGADGRRTSDQAPGPTTDQEVWCTSDFKVAPRLTEITNPALASLGDDEALQFVRLCPLALRTVLHVGTNPEVDIVWTITGIRRMSPPPELFKVPSGYRRTQ
ncbi:MAG TPA: hypothetical protein VGK32_00035 [Vicinamibacterales bacterium]|jgi:hypothetical protein